MDIDDKHEICSGCNKPKPTVKRHLFDGLCASCTDKALYNSEFAAKAHIRNNELKSKDK